MSGEDISPTVTNAILQKHAPELQRNISLNMLVPYLIAAELLTRDEEYTVTNLLLPHGERIMRLLSIIGMKGRNGPSRFLQSIRRSVDDHGAVAAGGHAYLDKLLSGGMSPLIRMKNLVHVANNFCLYSSSFPEYYSYEHEQCSI